MAKRIAVRAETTATSTRMSPNSTTRKMDRMGVQPDVTPILTHVSKPIATVGDPPTQEQNGYGCNQAPDQGKGNIGNEAEDKKDRPKHALLHSWRPKFAAADAGVRI